MGYAISWLAVKDTEPNGALKRLGLSPTGEFRSYPDHAFVGRALQGGWYLVVADRCDHRMITNSVLPAVSATCTVLACSIEEHVMYCSVRLWTGGKESWCVKHESEKGIMDLQVSGAPPPEFEKIRQNGFGRQISGGGDKSDVDYVFDIPLELAKHIVGFKHDEIIPDIEPNSFQILRVDEDGPLKKSRWKLW